MGKFGGHILIQTGPFLNGIASALAENWVTIVVTFIATIGTGIYGIRRQSSVKDNKIQQAKNDVLDVFEEDIINEKEISLEKMRNIINAVERKHGVEISNRFSRLSLLQDLQLRFEETRYLDPNQKKEYAEKIHSSITELREEKESLSFDSAFEEGFESVRENLDSGNIDEAKNQLKNVEEEVTELESWQKEASTSAISLEIEDTPPILIMLLFTAIFYYYAFTRILPNVISEPINFQSPILLLIGILIMLIFWAGRGVYRF